MNVGHTNSKTRIGVELLAVHFARGFPFLHLMEFRAVLTSEAHHGQDLVLVIVKIIQRSEDAMDVSMT